MVGEVRQTKSKEQREFRLPHCVPAFAESISISCIKLFGCFVQQDGCLFRENLLLPLIHIDFGPPCGPENLCLTCVHNARKGGFPGWDSELEKKKIILSVFKAASTPFPISVRIIQAWVGGLP